MPTTRRSLARDRAALATIASYGLAAGEILGDTTRSLDNGGGRLCLLGPAGQGIDSAVYDDEFPWPIAADALGGDEDCHVGTQLLPGAGCDFTLTRRIAGDARKKLEAETGTRISTSENYLDEPESRKRLKHGKAAKELP